MTNESENTQNDKEQRAYEALADKTREQLREITELTGDAISNAIDRAKQVTVSTGEYTMDELEKTSNYLRRDLGGLGGNLQQARAFVQKSADPSRIRSGFLGLASDLLTSAGDTLRTLGDKVEDPIRYNTGEVTSAGTLKCLNCDRELNFTDTGRVPPCPQCHKTEFRKSY